MKEDNSCLAVCIPLGLNDTLKSLKNLVLVNDFMTRSLPCGMGIKTCTRTVPSWFLFKLKVVQLT